MKGMYMAYVGSYSYTGSARGITVYDVDVEKGVFKERCQVDVDNSSYVVRLPMEKFCIPSRMKGWFPSASTKTEASPN